MNNPTYKIGQLVWLNIPEEGMQGIVIDSIFYTSSQKWKYIVRFPNLEVCDLTEEEISKKKRMVW